MEKLRGLSVLWSIFLVCLLEAGKAEEDNGYIFTCPRSLKTGATNQMQLRRSGELAAGELVIKISYTDGYSSNESIALQKTFDIEEGVADSYMNLYIKPFENYVYNGQITINGTFGDYVIGGVDKVYFSTAKDNIVFIQTDKPLYKEGQTVKFRVLRVDKDLKPSVEENADIWVEDPQGIRLFQWKDVSLGKGMKQFEFPLANEPVKGDWKISASFKGDTTTTTFEVKEYVLPKFEVKIKIPPFVLANAEEIPISICAKYTYGKPVRGNLRMNISLETYAWSNDKLPTLEYDGEIDGCFDYKINVTLVETEDYYRYRRIQVMASVEESGTGVQRNETQYIQRQYTPLTLSFNRDQRQFYKPGLPYNGKLFVKHPDNSPAPKEGIQICYTVTKERVVMDGKWKATRTVKYCQNYTSDEDGAVQFVIPRQNTDSVDINIEAKSLKYAKSSPKRGSQRQASLSQPQSSMSLTPWYSPSGSFIQLQQVQETLLCGTKRKFKLLFTSKTDSDFKFHYQVLQQGEVVQRGIVEKSFSLSDDVSSLYEEEDKVVDDFELQIVPAPESAQPPDSEEQEECKSAKEARYVPPVGEIDFEIDVDPSLSPSFHLLTYYVRSDRETVADSQKFTVEKCFKNQVKLQFGDDVKQPGLKTSVRVTSSPNSLCGIKVVDKSVSLLNSDDQLTTEKIFRILESFDNGMYYGVNHCNEKDRQPGLYKSANGISPPRPPQPWSSSSYEDSLAAFENAGFLVISDLVLFSRPCKSRGGGGNIVYGEGDYSFTAQGAGGAVAMASTARRPAAPQAADKMGDLATKSVVDVRDYFPDTWLFDLHDTGPEGVYQAKERLPHTITQWVGSAVCVSDESGLGLSGSASIRGFQAFFVSATRPYSVRRLEEFTVPVSFFNYDGKKHMPVRMSVDDPSGLEVVGGSTSSLLCISPSNSVILEVRFKGTSVGSQNITIRAESAPSSDACGSEEISDAVAKDAVTEAVIVEAEGWPDERIESVLFCPKDEENEIFSRTFAFDEPEDLVPDSARVYLDVTGNVLGKSLDNLESLVQLPTGCGEQNMVKFAPNVVVMDVLTESRQLTESMKSRITRNLQTGAQRQLQYRHSDGSFSAFGPRDREGSMFLTAFVVRYFAEASKYVTIDNATIARAQDWIAAKQLADGCFPNVGKIIDRGFQGGIESDTVTAYVLASLLISEYQNQTVIELALSCVENSKDSSLYAAFLFAYAKALANRADAAKDQIESARARAVKKGNTEYYHDANATKTQDIETSAYAVLSILSSGGSASDVLPIVQYLTQNMNPRGGFYSTQDTVVALQALGQFSKLTFTDEVNITVTASGDLEEEIHVSEDDKLIVKRHKVENVPSEVKVEAKGTGCAIIQSVLRYNTNTPPERRNFNLDVATKCLDDPCKRSSISISVSYIPEDKKTGMALIDVKMISGISPVRETLEALLADKVLKLMRYDVENNNVVFYFNEITNSEKNFSFELEEVFRVEKSQPGTIEVYDYYNRDLSSSITYKLGERTKEP